MNINSKQKKKYIWKPTATKKIFSYREIIGFTLLVLVSSLVIFPKGKIEKLILTEDTNVELSNIYLENLIRITKDENLMLLLAERYIKLGYKDKAVNLLNFLEKHQNKEVSSNAKILKYQILKTEYFSKNTSEERKEELKSQMRRIILDALNSTSDLTTLEKIYKEALSMAFIDIAYKTTLKAVSISKGNVFWLKEAFKQALATENYKDAQEFSLELYKIDEENRLIWLDKYYNISVVIKDYKSAVYALKLLAEEDKNQEYKYYQKIVDIYLYTKDYSSALNVLNMLYSKDSKNKYLWLDKIAQIYLSRKDYNQAFSLYNQAFLSEKNYQKRKELFKKSAELLLWSKDYERLKVFLSTYYKDFLDDKEMAKFILKTALATGDQKFAYKIALDIKQRGF
ncbi:MAG: tetratricopeptide repeat protein [Sulfurihydrogenibium sp.]|uniref:tetratricopeptide repeat protein n=1 Tax=Sulfurihydrogenibium sp. TaxID=2053621 RepID=UPI003C7BB97F